MLRSCLPAILLVFLLITSTSSQAATPQTSHDVEIFLTSWCPYCKKAVAFFQDRNISTRIFNIEKDPVAARRKSELDPRKGVPLVVIDNQVIYGFSPKAYNTALDD
jgi:glutaredoxin